MKTEGLGDSLLGEDPARGRVDYTTGFETTYDTRGGLFNGSRETRSDLQTICRDAALWNGNVPPNIRFAKGLSGPIETGSAEDIFREKGLPAWMIGWVDHVVFSDANGKDGWKQLAETFRALEPGLPIGKLTRQLTAERLLSLPAHLPNLMIVANRMSKAILELDAAEADDVIRKVTSILYGTDITTESSKAACRLVIDSWKDPDDQASLARYMVTASPDNTSSEPDILIRAAENLKRHSTLKT